MKNKITAIDAVQALYGLEKTSFVSELGEVRWKDGHKTTEEETNAINAKITELQADYDAKQYQRDRLKEYPTIQECIHAILDDDLTALQAKRKLVKEKYPKP